MGNVRIPNRFPVGSIVATAACTIALAAGCPRTHADESKTPLEVFGHLPTIEDMAMSPDGTKLAYVRTEDERRSVLIRQMGESKPLAAFRVGDTKLRQIQWMDDDNILLTRSSTGGVPEGYYIRGRQRYEWFQLAAYCVSKQKLADIDFFVQGNTLRSNAVLGPVVIRQVDGAAMLFAHGLYGSIDFRPALFKYSVADPHVWLVDRADEPTTRWAVDDSGRVAAKFVFHDLSKKWEILLPKEQRMAAAVSGQAEVELPVLQGFSSDGNTIIVEFVEDGDVVWKPLVLKDGSWGLPLAKGEAFSDVIVDRKSGRIIGGVAGNDDKGYVFFDAELQAHWDAALRAFPDEHVEIVSYSDDFSSLLLRVFGRRDGYAYARFDWYTHRATLLTPVYEGLRTVAEVKRIVYPAADGLQIPAFLTLPPGTARNNLPLIVLPHGGPTAADHLRFDWWSQALAAQGYAVLQPNYRGSSLSYKFESAGFGEWGRKMQTDLSDGVRYLAGQGVIDPKRVCIVGGSYGGYAALAGVTLESGVYRCAISVAGISDMKRFRESAGYTDNLVRRFWDRYLGISKQGDPVLAAVSPIEHLDKLTAPVLLIHGRDDTVVPFIQSDIMARVLKSAGKPVEFVTLKHEDHWLSNGQTRLQMLQASVDFLQKYNPAN
jgi:dipeptidyl aminopeptidase/acylaminoacyl peptidase